MKKTILALSVFLALVLVSCEGPMGPPGSNGIPGTDGSLFEAAAFEITINMNLDTDLNRYEFVSQYPPDIELIPDDVVLMYRLEEVNNGLNVWRQLPQPFFSDQGLLYYNFDFTQSNYSVFLEPEFDAATVDAGLVQEQVFRIVVIPAYLGTSSKLDKSNIGAVLNALGMEENDVRKIILN